jgi:hypothetical protein
MDNPTCTTTGTSTTTASTTPSRTRRPATGRARPRAAAGSDRGNPRPGAPPARRPSHATPGRAARCRGYRRGRPGPPRPGVVLRWDRQGRRQVRVGCEQVGQVLRAGCADHRRAPSIRGHPDKLGTTVGAWLHGEPADHEPVRVATHPGEAAERFGLCVVGLDPPAGQGVRTDGPQPAAGSRQTLEIRLGMRRPGKIDEIGQREAALAVADRRANGRIERQPLHRRRLIASQPQVPALGPDRREVDVVPASHRRPAEPELDLTFDAHDTVLPPVRAPRANAIAVRPGRPIRPARSPVVALGGGSVGPGVVASSAARVAALPAWPHGYTKPAPRRAGSHPPSRQPLYERQVGARRLLRPGRHAHCRLTYGRRERAPLHAAHPR